MQVCKEHYYTIISFHIRNWRLRIEMLRAAFGSESISTLHDGHSKIRNWRLRIEILHAAFGSESISTLHDGHSKVFSRLV